MNDLSQIVKDAIIDRDPNAFGDISVSSQSSQYTVTGEIHTSIEKHKLEKLVQEIVAEEDSSRTVFWNVKTPRRGLRVKSQKGKVITEARSRRRETKPLDEMDVIFYGLVDTNKITPSTDYKKLNHETFVKVKNIVEVLGIIEPLLVDKDYKIINGNMRLKIAVDFGIEQIPVMVVDDAGIKTDFLRLALNRSSEFQRWIYSEVDQFVDSIPQAQPLLEPIGFFGNKILPESFFGKTVMNYVIDDFNDQQKKYSQDIGLAAWAEMKRKEELRAEKKKQAIKDRKKTNPKGLVSLFDLQPTENDFLPTYDAQEEIQKNTEEMRELAGTITEAFDAKRKAEMEEKGVMWQNTRQTSQELADAKRAAAAEEAKASKRGKKTPSATKDSAPVAVTSTKSTPKDTDSAVFMDLSSFEKPAKAVKDSEPKVKKNKTPKTEAPVVDPLDDLDFDLEAA